VVIVSEGGPAPDFLYTPVGETTWTALPHPLLDRPISHPDARAVGTVHRIWREPARGPDGILRDDQMEVWAEGELDPGEQMPAPYHRQVLWLDELEATTRTLRENTERICTEVGSDWRDQTATELTCDPDQVGAGPLARHPEGRKIVSSYFATIVADLRDVDRRVFQFSVELPSLGWLDAAAVPLDNPFVVERVARWGHHLGTPPAPAPTKSPEVGSDPTTAATAMKQRLDTLGPREPPNLGL
jgi:hypothetical protein